MVHPTYVTRRHSSRSFTQAAPLWWVRWKRQEEKDDSMNPLRAAQRFYEMRSSWLGDGGQPVPQEQANARAAVCVACPKNQPHHLYEILTVPAVVEVERQLELRDKMKLHAQDEDKLHICEACWCVLRLKVHTPLKHILGTTDMNALDPRCWIIAENSKP
jgi:hypothetical protein